MNKRMAVVIAGLFMVFALTAGADARIRRGGGYQNPEGKFAFTTQMGAFVPTGEFGDIAETGIRWTGALDYYPSPDASIGLDFGFGEADANEARFQQEPPQVQSLNYRSYRLGVTGRFNILTRTGISPYLEAGTGIYWTQRRATGSFIQNNTLFEFSERRTHTTAGGLVGFGINAALGRRTNLYTGFQFHQLVEDDLERINSFGSLTFGLGIGLWP